MKGRRFFLLCFLLFALGCLGRVLLRPHPVPAAAYTVTVSFESIDTLLLSSLPEVGEQVSVEGVQGRVTEVGTEEVVLTLREGGKTQSARSALSARATVKITLFAQKKDERLILGERTLFLGDEVAVLGEDFVFSGRFWGFSLSHAPENA